jgi:hypothetical protein
MATNITRRVKSLLIKAQKGEVTAPEELIEEYGEMCKDAFRKHFTPRDREWYLRMSQLGKDLRWQQCDKLGLPQDNKPEDDPWLAMKFFTGDMFECAAVAIMKLAGIKIEEFQKDVKTTIGGQLIKGSYDVKIDGKIWDVKTASPWAFKNKFQKGLKALEEKDQFGYVMQLHLYSEADDAEEGGWIVIEKSTGEWHCTKGTPEKREEYLQQAEDTIKTLLSTKSKEDIDDALPLQEETYNRKSTGHYILHDDYKFFPYKKTLWGDKIIYEQYVGSVPKWYLNEVEDMFDE